MFVNENDGLQMKITFGNRSYKQRLLIEILANDNYQCKFKSVII